MEPFNYAAQLVAPGVADSYLGGLAIGSGLQDRRIEQQAAQAKLQAAQAAQEQALEKQRVLKEFSLKENPTAKDYAQISILLPELSEGFKRSWEILGPAQKDAHWNETVGVYAATQNQKPEVAAKILNDKADALEGSGDTAKAEQTRKMAQLVVDDPEYAKKMAYFSLHSVDPERAAKLSDSLDKQASAAAVLPGQIADSKTKQVQATYADSKALQELEKTGWDIKKLRADIESDKERNRIAAMTAAAAKETNNLKKQELVAKIEENKRERDEKIRGRVAEATSGANTIDNMLGTVDRILANGSLDSVVGSLQGRVGAYLSDEAADAIAQIETLGSQVFLSQIPTMKGTGSLTEKEGDKLQSSLQNLGRAQSEAQFRENLENVKKLGMKARKGIEQKYGAPLSAVDNPYAPKADAKAAPKTRSIVVDY